MKPPDGIRAVAFDLDGTLYPNYRLFFRLIPGLCAHPRFFRTFARVRRELHRRGADRAGPPFPSFYDEQAVLMAELLGEDPGAIRQKTETLVYRGWEEFFKNIALFPHVRETLEALRGAGLKTALLSDFPPARKIALLGLEGLFDALLSSEETGALKPSALPFAALERALGIEAPAVLYVGNSPRYDAAGARGAGMRTALLRRSFLDTGFYPRRERRDAAPDADVFVFHDYRQLREYVLG
ncbi:MAG: HAD family hydrolase [Treponema sp.]|nr:HAD family hydrolase [Treponema sp.]